MAERIKERGTEFVQEMVEDEAANRDKLAKLAMELAGRHGGDVSGPDTLKLRSIIKMLRTDHPEPKQLEARAVAADGKLEMVYYVYRRFSLDAVHCSVSALGRHVSGEHSDGRSELILSVIPNTPPEEVLDTVTHANHALLCAAIGVNELVRCDSSNTALSRLWDEFKANGWPQ